MINEISPELVGKVNKARLKKPSKTEVASKTLSKAVNKAWIKSSAGKIKEDAPVPQNVRNIPGKASVLGQGSGVMRALDLFLVYQFMKRLLLPFDKWPAYEAGIIDADGKVLRKRNTLSGPERGVWGLFDIMTANIKKIIMKAPGGKTKLASALAAAYLLKEMNSVTEENVDLVSIQFEKILNEEIANNVGDGKVAGLGVGPQGEPGRSKKSLKIIKRSMRAK